MEKVSWKHSKAYHTISFSLSPEGRFLISEWKTGSRESQRKACGCHPEGAPWPTTAAALWPTPALAPGLPSAPGPGWGGGWAPERLLGVKQSGGFCLAMIQKHPGKSCSAGSGTCCWGSSPWFLQALMSRSFSTYELWWLAATFGRGGSNPADSSQTWPVQMTISCCNPTSDPSSSSCCFLYLSSPTHCSLLPSQAPISASLSILSTRGQEPQHDTQGDRSTSWCNHCHIWA